MTPSQYYSRMAEHWKAAEEGMALARMHKARLSIDVKTPTTAFDDAAECMDAALNQVEDALAAMKTTWNEHRKAAR